SVDVAVGRHNPRSRLFSSCDSDMTYRVITFYKFVPLRHLETLRDELEELLAAQDIQGTILLATEGVNGTLAGSEAALNVGLAHLRAKPEFHDLEHKTSTAERAPFGRLKVKIKRELIPLGVDHIDPSLRVGAYVEPRQWNALIADPDVVVIDTRNEYEVAIGTFHRAQNPHLQTFRQFPDYAQQHLDPHHHKKVAMFCTGGIRCEKATAYLLEQGFEEVYHLKGGILKYLEDIPEEESLWNGECFVFDDRVAVVHGLAPGSYEMCYACGHPISPQDKETDAFQPGISCPHCLDSPSSS
ncbi:MAG: rhodanese-related sulfurtransferase, partial [Cyanobacteria bacterium P01_A01_bin.37]